MPNHKPADLGHPDDAKAPQRDGGPTPKEGLHLLAMFRSITCPLERTRILALVRASAEAVPARRT